MKVQSRTAPAPNHKVTNLVACRNACQLVQAGIAPLVPALPPGEALWQTLSHLHLTDRQGETMAWLAVGASDQEIATQLGVSVRTVHAHLRAIFEILGVENRLAAVLATCRHFTRYLAYEGE
jgi:DNA-binding CsgD family transcriptional regulator